MLGQVEPYVGNFFSKTWVQKNILRQTDEEIEEIFKKIELEKEIEGGGEEDQFESKKPKGKML